MTVQLENYDFEVNDFEEKNEKAALVVHYRSLKDAKQRLEKDLTRAETRLKEICAGETSVEFNGLKVQLVTAKGTVQWRTVPELVGLSEQYLDSFRGKNKEFYKFSFYS